MAEAHPEEHSATGDDAESGTPPADGFGRTPAALLGVNAWIACAGWPALVSEPGGGLERAWIALPLGVLALGVARLPRPGPRTLEATSLVLGLPLSVGAALCFGPQASLERLGGPIWLALAAASLLAYGAHVTHITRPTRPRLETLVQPLSDDPWDVLGARATAWPRAVTALLSLGALSLVLVAATWGGTAALEDAWGDAATEGGLLTAVVTAAIAVTTIAAFLGGALRTAATPEGPPIDRPLRVASLMLLALLGATTYVIVR